MVLSIAPKTPQFRVPAIAAGMGEKAKPAKPSRPLVVARARPAPPAKASPQPRTTASVLPKPAPIAACPSDEQRLRNYAGRMVEGLGVGPTDDLKLFTQDGVPLPNLARVMLAMSAFELGALRASPDLVERAIQRAAAKAEERRAALESPGPRTLDR
jgi:hypothetical protein